MKKKALQGLKVIDAAARQVEAVFATLNVIDSDGDVTRKGAFQDGAEVRISAYNHASWNPGMLPVGKGTIAERGNEAILTGNFFDTSSALETFDVVKQMGSLQEWSYGYDIVKSEPGTFDGRDVTFLDALIVHEVSPVILGAGVDTRTLSAKGKQLASDLSRALDVAGTERFGGDKVYVYIDDFDLDASWVVYSISTPDEQRFVRGDYTRADNGDVTLADSFEDVERTTNYRPKGRKLSDHLTDVIADVEEVTSRVADVKDKRSEQGKNLGERSTELVGELESRTSALREVLTSAAGDEPGGDLGLDVALAVERSRVRL